ncbi:hypothetical protein CS542_00730 [Pedobacter sp. IW39]|nr:hypothetical protein CS542_00730 [Pedobacter sp. IW39]
MVSRQSYFHLIQIKPWTLISAGWKRTVLMLQRFNANPAGGEGPMRDAITAKVKTAAELTIKFYIMYDVSGWDGMSTQIKAD